MLQKINKMYIDTYGLTPSTSTSWVQPTEVLLAFVASSRKTVISSSKRLNFTSSRTSSFSLWYARVFYKKTFFKEGGHQGPTEFTVGDHVHSTCKFQTCVQETQALPRGFSSSESLLREKGSYAVESPFLQGLNFKFSTWKLQTQNCFQHFYRMS